MKRKGISPLIAAVLLIAFTMAVAAILTAWVTSFTQDTTGQVGNESERLVSCSFASIDIYDAVLSGSTLTVNVANTGTRDLNNVTLVLFHDDGSINETWAGPIASGDVVSVDGSGSIGSGAFNNVGTTSVGDLDRVRASSPECPEASVETSDFTQN